MSFNRKGWPASPYDPLVRLVEDAIRAGDLGGEPAWLAAIGQLGGITGPVCDAWGPLAAARSCPHASCWDVMAFTDGPGWWSPEDWPDAEVPF